MIRYANQEVPLLKANPKTHPVMHSIFTPLQTFKISIVNAPTDSLEWLVQYHMTLAQMPTATMFVIMEGLAFQDKGMIWETINITAIAVMLLATTGLPLHIMLENIANTNKSQSARMSMMQTCFASMMGFAPGRRVCVPLVLPESIANIPKKMPHPATYNAKTMENVKLDFLLPEVQATTRMRPTFNFVNVLKDF